MKLIPYMPGHREALLHRHEHDPIWFERYGLIIAQLGMRDETYEAIKYLNRARTWTQDDLLKELGAME